ncbi:hypothetical protein EDB83DRAFT_2677753 [Lactarius deliciosus]|nr:hypothetical protein EDB83DRAFT_2677753 [Lactarius deliciosus]
MSRAVTSNAETTGNLDELPLPSHSTPFTQLPPSSSPSVLESQHGLVHSVTLDQPELAHTLSTTLPPSDSPPSHTPSLAYSATDNDPISAPTFPITTSTLPPSVSPTLSHDSLLAHLAADVHEIPSTSSPTLAPFSMPISSDFEYLPSATVDHPASTRAARTRTEPIPLIAPASTFASMPLPSSSSTFPTHPVISATDCQPTSEPASAGPVSKFDLTLRVLPLSPDQKLDLLPRALSPPPGCLLVLPISSPTLSSLPLPEISSLGSGSLLVAPSPDQPSSLLESLSQLSRPCELESSTLVSADVVTLSHPELPLSSPEANPFPSFPRHPKHRQTRPFHPIRRHRNDVPNSRRSAQFPPRLKFTKSRRSSRRRSRLVSVSSTPPSPRLSGTSIHFGFAFRSRHGSGLVSTLINVRQLFSPTRASFGASETSATFGSTPSKPQVATRSRIGFDSDSSRPALHASFSTLEAQLSHQISAPEDVRRPKSKTLFISFTTLDTGLLHSVSTLDDLIVFDSGGGALLLELADEDIGDV